jgi:transcription elongation factor GreA
VRKESEMSDSAVIKKVQEMLNEEKWTRAALGAYSVSQFKDLDLIIREASEERIPDELKETCDEHISHTKTSIIALYISGVLSLMRQTVDDSCMITLINLFSDNKRWIIVEFLCQRILEYGDDKNALRTLAECYKNDNRESEVWDIYDRLVKVDFEEADIVKLLAEKREKDGDAEAALDLYRKALHRYINKKSFTNIKEIWNKLIETNPQDLDFFIHVQRKIGKMVSPDKAAMLLQDLYKKHRQSNEIDVCIQILKLAIEHDEKDPWVRREITECYREKFKDHSHLEEYVKLSALASGPRNIHEAIADFEKHISFDSGNFVFHRTWGVGRIAAVEGDDITIDFSKARGHKMSLKMAVNSLTTLSRDHIWVLKSIWKKDKLHEKVKTDPTWALKTIIRSFDNRADLKRVKAEIVPSILTASEWNSWSTRAREELKVNPLFGNVPEAVDTYIVRDRPISSAEKIYNQFKAEKNFFPRVQHMRAFLENADADSEFFNEMFSYFTGYFRAAGQVTEYTVAAYLFIRELCAKYPALKYAFPTSFLELLERVDSIEGAYECIKDAELRKSLLTSLRSMAPNWPDIYVRLFPYSLSLTIIHVLLDSGYRDKVRDMAMRIIENYRDRREAFLWLVKTAKEEEWFKSLGLPEEKTIITLIHILDITFKEIENHRETTQNRKVNRQVQQILFKDTLVEDYLARADVEMVTRIISLIEDVKDLDAAIKMKLRKKITDRFPDFKFVGAVERHIVSRGLLVTAKKYEEKQKLLAHLLEVEVPANSHEIAAAVQLGDLRENAEYKAAKEKQDNLNSTVGKIKNEIERAQIFHPNAVNAGRVSFGTDVRLRNAESGADERYIIMGPWESDPSQSIISYLSPFGAELMGHVEGDVVSFVINGKDYKYEVLKIAATDF